MNVSGGILGSKRGNEGVNGRESNGGKGGKKGQRGGRGGEGGNLTNDKDRSMVVCALQGLLLIVRAQTSRKGVDGREVRCQCQVCH